MSEAAQQEPEQVQEAPVRQRRGWLRWARRAVLIVAGVLGALVFALFTVDVGDISIGGRSLRTIAESEASKFLKRPMTVGAIHAHLRPGVFVLEDVAIAGPTPDDRPFFTAKRIKVEVPLWALIRRRVIVNVELDGWRMVVERWADGYRTPNMTARGGGGPRRFDIRVPYVFANNGEFVYDDHLAPWSVTAPNLQFEIVRAVNVGKYVGKARFSEAAVRIMDFEPMRADFNTRFIIEGSSARLLHIDLITDGARSRIHGNVDFAKGVAQDYYVHSDVDFARMREIFFARSNFRLSGEGKFSGIFKVGGGRDRDLSGEFRSENAGLGLGSTEWRFPHLHGTLEWTPHTFAVTHAESDFLGGLMRLEYGLGSLGRPGGAEATFVADYENVDVYRLTRQFSFTALEPQGRLAGHVSMNWRNGHFGDTLTGTGYTRGTPPAGQAIASETPEDSDEPIPPEVPFQAFRPLGEFAIGADTSYRFGAGTLEFDPGWVATPTTFVRFDGRALGGPVDVRFKVTSHDWQKSDRLFTAIMSNFGRPTGAIPVGGRGTFDGRLTRTFRDPRIAGTFSGRAMRAWDVVWGRATGDLVVDNRYVEIVNAVVDYPEGGRIETSGRYSLGYPRHDALAEIDARVIATNMPLEPLKTAFRLGDWPVFGTLASADLTLRGDYERPYGSGSMRLADGSAWNETFSAASSDLVFGGNGSLRLSRLSVAKGAGTATGSALLNWADGAYAFDIRSDGIQIDEFALLRLDGLQFYGRLAFATQGTGRFDDPAWSIEGRIPDLYVEDEGIGLVIFRLSVANGRLRIEQLAANSVTEGRLRADCTGTIATNDALDAKLQCTMTNTSIDPYAKFFMREMPLTRAIVTGSAGLIGPLRDRARITGFVNLTDANFQLFDYRIANDGPLRVAYRDDAVHLERVRFQGDRTSLHLSGGVDMSARRADLRAEGAANLAVLQAFYPLLTTEGGATIGASLGGSFDSLELRGRAELSGGSLRHREMPHGIREINGPIVMEAGRISVDGLQAVIGEGDVRFSGEILLDGYRPVEYDLHATGHSLYLRYPAGLQSTVNASVHLTGPVLAPTLSGDVDVLHATYAMRYQPQTGYIGFLTGAIGGGGDDVPVVGASAEPAVPLTLAIKVRAGPPSLPFVDTTTARLSATGDIDITGTIDHPVITGRLRLDRGTWSFSGYRYRLLGGSVDFTNPEAFEPFFDVTAETEVRTGGQSYRVTLRITGTLDKLEPVITSDPWLPEFQVISLLLGETPDPGTAELRARMAPQDLQAEALRTAAVAIVTSPISATVGTAVQRVTTIDTVQFVPLLNEGSLQQINPSARIVLGKRISNRVYLTYSRTLSGAQNELILVEFDQSDQISWVLSRNEDRTFALDFRLRYTFR